MKKCPYCAEMIQDEAIKCRYCHSDLTVEPGATGAGATGTAAPIATAADPPPAASPTPTAPASSPTPEAAASSPTASPRSEPVPEASPSAAAAPEGGTGEVPAPAAAGDVRYTHSGYRYVLGYSADAFGIWDRQSPSQPSERFPRTDDGWRQAWLRFVALEPNNSAVDQAAAGPATATPAGGAAFDPDDVAAVQYTHSGTRYLLGYGRTFFGIWDRQSPATPVEKFPRDDAGWAAAWSRFTQIEQNFTEVSLGG